MSWDDYFSIWEDIRQQRGTKVHAFRKDAQKRARSNSPEDWDWLIESLAHPDRKYFVAMLFEKQSVPKKMVRAFFRAAILETDPSVNRFFIEPCVRSRGSDFITEKLLKLLLDGSIEEKIGATSALYWVGGSVSGALQAEVRETLLRQFVDIEDITLRRYTLSKLSFESSLYKEELHSLLPVAISIARNHSDAYIRHRIEVQPEHVGLFVALPAV